LQDGAYLGEILKDQKQANVFDVAAKELYARFNERLWDASAGTYHGAIMNGKKTPITGHAAMLALYYDMVPAERHASTLQFMRDKFDDGFPYSWFFFLEVLYRQNRPETDVAALKTIRKYWAEMLTFETETTSEALGGCAYAHEAGAVPTLLLSRFVLGVRNPETFKDRNILIEPRLGDLKHAEGTVLTSLGPVNVSWRRPNDQSLDFQFDVPAGAVADVVLPCLGDKPSLTLNGENMVKDGTPAKNVTLDALSIRFQAKPGKYEGKVTR
jgi:hypothetical protein